MKLEKLHHEITSDGFGVIQGLLPPSDLVKCRRAVDELNQMQRDGRLPFSDKGLIHSPMFLREEIMDLLNSESLCSVVDYVLDSTAILYASSTSTVDSRDTNYAGRIHVDSPRIIPGYITNLNLIIPLSDFTEENGATQLLPKSFERASAPTVLDFEKNSVTVSADAGDCIVFNARTWHRSTPNHTDSPRLSITFGFCRSFMRQRFDYPRMVADADAIKLSARQRRFLGFDVQMPTSFEEFAAPPELRKYKPNQG